MQNSVLNVWKLFTFHLIYTKSNVIIESNGMVKHYAIEMKMALWLQCPLKVEWQKISRSLAVWVCVFVHKLPTKMRAHTVENRNVYWTTDHKCCVVDFLHTHLHIHHRR